MKFTKTDKENWDRRENYKWFIKSCPCKMNMTANVDITNLISEIKVKKLRAYPVLTWIVSKIINSHEEYRMAHDSDGNIGTWDKLNPRYPIFRESDKQISIVCTEFSRDFQEFYIRFLNDIKADSHHCAVSEQDELSPNIFHMSSIPWVSFTDFSFDIQADNNHIQPCVVTGKYFNQDNKILLPVSMKLHHATCDGYHMARFFQEFEVLASQPLNSNGL